MLVATGRIVRHLVLEHDRRAKLASPGIYLLPKAIADLHNIRPGSEIQFESGIDCIRIVVGKSRIDGDLWAYAEHYRCSVIYSEDFEHGRYYGSVKAINPFI